MSPTGMSLHRYFSHLQCSLQPTRVPATAAMFVHHTPAKAFHVAQVVQEFLGYTIRRWACTAYILLTMLTGGLIWVVEHYFPQALVWTMKQSPLGHATWVQAKVPTY